MLQGSPALVQRARKLRKTMSLPEVLLWRALRLRPGGLKFRRQHPSVKFSADFYCHEARLILEVDGLGHDCGDQPARDVKRDTWFAARRIKVMRIPARKILRDLNAVVEGIVAEAQRSSPIGGGGRRQPDGGLSSSRVRPRPSDTPRAGHPSTTGLTAGGPPPLSGEDFSKARSG
ncbi:MAG: endonuclease domain-containing protein [Sphingomonadaceae bacterium]|nr:endonuclease domain-containing protein [Sphingomonadaceae bacterium]